MNSGNETRTDMDTIRVFIACAPNGEDAESLMVLHHTIKKVTTGPVEIEHMMLSPNKDSPWAAESWNSEMWPTPFSAFRWGIPWRCGYKGRAIYMDSDMIVMRDLRDLWNLSIPASKIVAAKSPDRFCVCLWDNEKVGKLVVANQLPDAGIMRSNPMFHESMKQGFMSNPHLIEIFDRNWNNFDGEDRPLSDAFILHYTDMRSQVHAKYALARLATQGKSHWFDGEVRPHWRTDLQALFDDFYQEALAAGLTPETMPCTNLGSFRKLSQKGYVANHGFDPK